MALTDGPLSWGEEAELLQRIDLDEQRPEWMPSREDIDACLLETRGARILVTGSESWEDKRAIAASLKRALKYLSMDPEQTTLIHGASAGADTLAAGVGRRLGMAIESHRPEWSKHSESCPRQQPADGGCWAGRSSCMRGGFRRNREMVESGADILVAFIRDRSPGATDALELWLQRDRPAILCRQDDGDSSVSGEFLNMERWRD